MYEGATETFFYEDLIDGRRNDTIKTGKDFKTNARWGHHVLKVTTTQDRVVTLESYSLASDGTMTATVLRREGKPVTLVFIRK